MQSGVEHLRETTISRETIFRGGIITLHHDKVDLPSGRIGEREVVEHPGSVGVAALDGEGRVLLVRQWRHPLERELWEICAGTLHAGEDPAECAKRELEEETGYTAAEWTEIGQYSLVPGYSTEAMHFYLARGLTQGTAHPDEDEVLDAEFFDAAGLRALIAACEVDMKTIGGLALAGVRVDA
jgi:ADP-ribose pyrophosphatase